MRLFEYNSKTWYKYEEEDFRNLKEICDFMKKLYLVNQFCNRRKNIMEKSRIKMILSVQFVLTLLGTVLALVLLVRTLKAQTLLSVLGSIVYLVAYLALMFYASKTYSKKENVYFQGVIYAYAALLGMQILQSGNYISDYGLAQNLAIIINCFNIICFANVVKFSDCLDNKKCISLYYNCSFNQAFY